MQTTFARAAIIVTALLGGPIPRMAGAGHIRFTGGIVEATCPARDGRLDCPSRHVPATVVRTLDGVTALRDLRAELLAYALRRAPTVNWSFVDVTYR